jgi:hypothetical protein
MQSKLEHDPLKNIFLYPKENNYVNDLVYSAQVAGNQKYGQKFRDDKTIQYMFTLLQDPEIDDDVIKTVAITFFLVWEKKLREEVNTTKNNEFDTFIIKMDEFVEKTIKFPINEYNIIEIIDKYFESAQIEFWMGPF